jgi:hypothetical protein
LHFNFFNFVVLPVAATPARVPVPAAAPALTEVAKPSSASIRAPISREGRPSSVSRKKKTSAGGDGTTSGAEAGTVSEFEYPPSGNFVAKLLRIGIFSNSVIFIVSQRVLQSAMPAMQLKRC